MAFEGLQSVIGRLLDEAARQGKGTEPFAARWWNCEPVVFRPEHPIPVEAQIVGYQGKVARVGSERGMGRPRLVPVPAQVFPGVSVHRLRVGLDRHIVVEQDLKGGTFRQPTTHPLRGDFHGVDGQENTSGFRIDDDPLIRLVHCARGALFSAELTNPFPLVNGARRIKADGHIESRRGSVDAPSCRFFVARSEKMQNPFAMAAPTQPHSAEHFGKQRDFWWHRDFLDLMAARWRLGTAASMADIGCGQCHWSRLLYSYLRQPARFAGVDREPQWVREGAEQFRRAFPGVPSSLLSFHEGDAARLPLPDNSFEVVTCQTVLMHLPQPLDALREMQRILNPGGLLVCVEPNNLWNYLAFTSRTAEQSTEALVRQFDFWLRCHRGRIAAGQGDHNIGDLLPGYFAQLGLKDIAVYQSDRAASLFPPYQTPAQSALVQATLEQQTAATGPWDGQELRRLFLLGGGTEQGFDQAFAEVQVQLRLESNAIAEQTFHAGYGGITYLVSGRKS